MTRAGQRHDRQPVATTAQSRLGSWATTPESYLHGYSFVQQVDILAHELERKWGIDRLRLLVEPELRARFDTQRYKLDKAIESGTSQEIEVEARRTINAWRALDRAATASGAETLAPQVLEVAQPDGSIIAVVQSYSDAHLVKAQGRATIVISAQEVVNILNAYNDASALKIAYEVFKEFPGARVTPARKLNDPIEDRKSGLFDDAIPF